jgi:hypothetical protein
MTDAESVWDDDDNSEAAHEEFLRKQAAKVANSAEADEDEEEREEAEEEAEDEELDDDEDELEWSADEDDDEEDEDVVDAADEETAEDVIVAPAAEDESVSSPAKPTGMKMAKKASRGKTKADSIREVIEARRAAGSDLRPRDIIAALEKKGIEVNASQVSITLRSMGIPAARKGGGGRPPAVKESGASEEAVKSRATAKARAKDVETDLDGEALHSAESMLDAAAEFIQKAGNFANASAALSLYNRIAARD